MPLPTTGLTFHVDASDTDRLWRQTGMSSHPTDGQNVQAWDDEADATNFALESVGAVDTDCPIYSAASFNGLGSLTFNGVDELLELFTDDHADPVSISSLITNTTCTVFLSIIAEAASSTNAAATYDNEGIFSDDYGYVGLHLKSNAGVHTLMAYNYDGNDDHADVVISLNTRYAVMVKHTGGNLSINVNNGALTASVASGTTEDVTGPLLVGMNGAAAAAWWGGKLGEMGVYNIDVTGTDLTNAWTHMMDTWVNDAGGVALAALIGEPVSGSSVV